jgi:acetyltransferase-like isoleucine patch superfamily enzyme
MLTRIVKRLYDRLERRFFGLEKYYRRHGAIIGSVAIFSSPRLAEPHLCEIGDNVWITANVTLLNHDGGIAMLNRAGLTDAVNIVGRILIRDNVFIGMGSIILPDVEIGPNAIVASGSIVTKDVPPNSVVGGCPAKHICTISEYLDKYMAEEETFWIDSEDRIRDEVIRYFMTENNRGKKSLRMRAGKTKLTSENNSFV